MENINTIMDDLKDQLSKGRIQKAYRYIFNVFDELGNELKDNKDKTVSTNSLYHGYLDMTYLPVITKVLKDNGLIN